MDQHRHCKCGAVYRRTESMASRREVDSFECKVCGATMETWNTAWVPSYRMIVGPNVDAVAGSRPFNSLERAPGTIEED
jgi:hypothetical protein